MTRKEKAIKLFYNIQSLQMKYCCYVLFNKGRLSLLEWVKANPYMEISMLDYEWKIYHKLYPIIFMETEIGAPSMYLLTKELYEEKERLFFNEKDNFYNDLETFNNYLRNKQDWSEELKNLNNI